MHEAVCLNKRAIAITYIDLGLWTALGENSYTLLININGNIPMLTIIIHNIDHNYNLKGERQGEIAKINTK